ncbi:MULTISPECIES: endonuclease domain-containing protein [Microbacterium]|uniref:endonuclease domain-containing protein n=1 Tax=Microbacterium TaxID=33882 RepID=UPI00278A28D2|nr:MULTISPECIES: DUF559 domain-containing protein [Microbacterium]MDQ1075914.1 hypothetical protein [Microbacterium sp. SORGH_AS_0969]MDQ1116158.1 hypothetical protein [Microbacterium testaceum]
MRVVAQSDDDLGRIAALVRALPDGAFCCGPTAAVILGLPLPRRWESRAMQTPFVGVPRSQVRIRRKGVIGRRLDVTSEDVVEIGGIRCSSPVRTWAELAEWLSVAELTAITDRLLSRRHPLATRADLETMHNRLLGGRGSLTRRRSIDMASDGSESPRESALRVLLVTAGLPVPECNVEIFDGYRFVARVDMLFRDARLIVEYDGDYHRDPRQWSRDQVRRAELESLGYRVTVVTARDFDAPDTLIARIHRLLSRRLA